MIFIVSEWKGTLKVFNQCKYEKKTIQQSDTKGKHALTDPTTKCTYFFLLRESGVGSR